ncbi:MAG: pyridine nucleotide-disulfide oxidoreductase [Cellulomonas sp. 73-92]|uniref:FAD-dependent oxidoreductase n=1 Tax=Cellulomonas sp. 73-92 TaxID=1895740 RepID=UPI0009284513|nr:FAD-dependent oxidoreductase [Cellulomonas sp. 73-92]OJV80725.1 MAG: pyridine nucleotide-disulfide oxidoreductase [Cellulomonas sp. 73-92]
MRIVVVGGVAGGMSAAARARRLDETAEIVVLERGPYVSFANCGLPYYVGGEITDPGALQVQTPESLRAALALDVRTGHDVIGVDPVARTVTVSTADGVDELGYDALVLSPGAKAVRPPIPGLDSPRVSTLRTVDEALMMRARVTGGAGRAVVLGAGFIGVEAAEALAKAGLTVTLVELAPHVLPPLEEELAFYATHALARLGIDVRAGVAATEIEHGAERDVVVLGDGSRLEADLVVLSVGVRPDTEVFERAGVACERGAIVVDEHGRTSQPGIWAVGDAVVSVDAVTHVLRPVPLAGPANRAGRFVADDILRPATARPIPPTTGTAIVRVGDLTAAMTGANRAALDAAGIDYRTLHLHPGQHASYFPGTSTLHLVVHIAPADGRVLGAQVVGEDGADKRIDVLSTAIRAGMTVDDLVDLDLAYAPPYGSAKDPVTMTGFVGQNVVDGTLRLWYPDDIEQVVTEALVLDVRTAGEFARGHLNGALNVPHTELRERIGEVREAAAGRPVRVMCHSGWRSYLAHRILVAQGFDSASLSGGMETLAAALQMRAAAPQPARA